MEGTIRTLPNNLRKWEVQVSVDSRSVLANQRRDSVGMLQSDEVGKSDPPRSRSDNAGLRNICDDSDVEQEPKIRCGG